MNRIPAPLERGEIWWANCELAIEDGLWDGCWRPLLLLSRGEAPDLRAMIIVAPAMTDIRGIALEVAVGAEEGLDRPGVLRVAVPRAGRIFGDWLGQVARSDLVRRAGSLSSAKLGEVEDILRLAQIDPSRWAA